MADEVEGLWLTCSALARERGVSKQALAKRVERLESLGHLRTRTGPRGSRLVNVAAFDHAVGQTADAVRALNGGGSVESAPAATVPGDPILAREQARRAAYDADLKQLDLEERLGKLVPIADVRASVTEAGSILVRALDGLPAKADTLLTASHEGPAGARRFLRELGIELRTVMAKAMQAVADGSAQKQSESFTIQPEVEELQSR